MPYFENLSNCGVCPHADAFEPDGVKAYYRVVREDPVTSESFLPTPVRVGFEIDPCIAKAVSIYDSLDGIQNGYSKTPALKKKQGYVAVLVLKREDGLLKKTFSHGHHSWWRSRDFDHTTATTQPIGPANNQNQT